MADPVAGEALKMEQVEEILEAVAHRKKNFPDEPENLTWALVLMNIGNRYSSVNCIEGEWVGKVQDVPLPENGGVPQCPNGHPLVFSGAQMKLGWVLS